MSSAAPRLSLAFGFRFDDLYSVAGLARLDGEFVRALAAADAALADRLAAARHDPAALAYREEAELLIAAAPHLDRFVARLFAIEEEFHISIPDDRARSMKTFGDMVDSIEMLLGTGGNDAATV